MKQKNKKLKDIRVGDSASFKRVITRDDIILFSKVSGDTNPLHMDASYAAQTEFKSPIGHGMLLAACVSRLVGMELPGQRSLLIKESLEFKSPYRIGDQLVVKGTVDHVSAATRIVELHIEIFVKKKVIALGAVHVKVLDDQKK